MVGKTGSRLPRQPGLAVRRAHGRAADSVAAPRGPGALRARTTWTLNRGVGWIDGTARPGESGNLGIAGHRDGFFRGLKDIGTGDTITLETLAGSQADYVVDGIPNC